MKDFQSTGIRSVSFNVVQRSNCLRECLFALTILGIKRYFSRLTASLMIAFALCQPAGAQTSEPNVLLIILDDLNDYIGSSNGHPQADTPSIDLLAAQGASFSNAHAPAPLCNPSRVSFMTGISPARSGIKKNQHAPWRNILPQAVSLNQAFRDSGYETVGYGKIYHGNANNRDLDNWDLATGKPTTVSPPANQLPLNGLTSIDFINFGDWGEVDEPHTEWGDYKIATLAADFISNRDPGNPQPFFLALGFQLPHSPWYVPPAYYDLIANGNTDEIVLPLSIPDDLDDVGFRAAAWARSNVWLPVTADPERSRELIHSYLGGLKFVDDQIGRVMDALDASIFMDNTIVVLLSDNGFHLSEKQTLGKTKLWTEDTRVPLIIRLPASMTPASPAQFDEPVNIAAVFPTLLELAEISLPAYYSNDALYRIDFRSLVPLLYDASTAQWEGPAATFGRNEDVSVITDQYRFTLYQDNFVELYDHLSDPNEWMNIASSYPQLVASMTSDAKRYLDGNHEPFGFTDCVSVDCQPSGGTSRIGDFVWLDQDGNGIQDTGESGFSDVIVNLLDCSGNTLGSTITNSSGNYLFDTLEVGSYVVEFIVPDGYELSPRYQAGWAIDSNPEIGSGRTGCVSLAAGKKRFGVDAGLKLIDNVPNDHGSIGDLVWIDLDQDGIQGSGEVGFSGATVNLMDCSNNLLASTTTNSNGNYVFDALSSGNYKIEFVIPDGYILSPRFQGSWDNDSNPKISTGRTGCRSLGVDQVWQGIDAGLISLI